MPKTILVAEDSLMLRKVACFPLEKTGYKVLEANNGIEAIEAMSKNHVDMLITDLNMPGMDGFELIAHVKEDEKFKRNQKRSCKYQDLLHSHKRFVCGRKNGCAKPCHRSNCRAI